MAEIVVGALLILLLTSMISDQLGDISARGTANDLELIISTISFSNENSYINYPVSKDIMGVIISLNERNNEYELSIISRRGNHKVPLSIARGVKLETASFSEPLFIPISFDKTENVIRFDLGSIDECKDFTRFDSDTKFRLFVFSGQGSGEQQSLNKIIEALKFKDLEDKYFDDLSSIFVSFVFSDNPELNISQNLVGGESFSCYLDKRFYDLNLETNFVEEPNRIVISLGSYTDFLRKSDNNNIDLEMLYSELIYSVFEGSVQ